MKVLKFGGSSICSSGLIKKVIGIIEKQNEEVVVIVSAFKGVTDRLEEVINLAIDCDTTYTTELEELTNYHLEILDRVVAEEQKAAVTGYVQKRFSDLHDILKGVDLLNDITPKIKDYILSFGEELSSFIISNSLKNGFYADSRDLITTDSDFGSASVDFEHTNVKIASWYDKSQGIPVVPGFIAKDKNGVVTTLGRGGSDYTAAIFAAALKASSLEIWTDVDGFMTADPKKVSKAFAIERLSYAEAMELSHFGARVIYTPTIQPVYKAGIPVIIKNSFDPEKKGTIISQDSDRDPKKLIKGISSVDDITLITIQGPGLVGVRGISSRLFGVLGRHNINVILITQASSEYSITFAISPQDKEKAVAALQYEFRAEITEKAILVQVEEELSVIAIVGESMKDTPGISANLFQSLGRNGISVIATAQGSSELNISVVIRKKALKKALNVIHEGFFLSHIKELHLYIVGIGLVGSDLLRQIKQQQEKLMGLTNLKINVVCVSNSRKMLIDSSGINMDNYSSMLEENGEKADLNELVRRMRSMNLRNSVFVDCTANAEVSEIYADVLDSFVSIVAANKIACSSKYANYRKLKDLAVARNVKFMFETNVGAGLPIINTLNDLIRSGDRILAMQAVLSGTLNYIFNVLSEDIPLSKAILMAKEQGFSEPDPRIDLSGIDVVRKILILAREAEYELEQDQIEIKPFLPEECFEGTLDDFWTNVKKYDDDFEAKRKKLAENQKKWRFVAQLNEGKTSVELMEVDASHPAYNLEGSNNIILITTERYNEEPMVIKGYGAGASVTAAGIFADIIRIANV